MHDIGKTDWSPTAGCHVQSEGWVQPVLRKIFGAEIEIKTRRLRDLSLVPKPKISGLQGHGRRAAVAKLVAKIEGCERVVFVADADTNDTAERADRLQTIWSGFSAVENGIAGTGCVPQSTSESWLLADKGAWQAIAPGGFAVLPAKSPEKLWGKPEDPNGNHPKHVLARACAAAGISPNREFRVDLAEASDLEEWVRRCPESVPPFLEDCKTTAV